MSTTTRERLEQAVATMQKYADDLDAKGVAPSNDEQVTLIAMATEVAEAKKAFGTLKAARATMNDGISLLKSLDAAPAGATLNSLDVEPGRLASASGKTFGELFVASGAYSDFRKKYGGRDGVIPSSTKGINSGTFQSDMGVKTLITGASATSAGAAVRNDLYAPITDLVGERELSVVDLITKGSTESDTVEYVRVTGKTNNAAPVPEATTSATPGLGGVAVAAYTSAHGVKPESGVALEVVSTTVKTLAHWIPITKRAASDAGQVRTLVDAFLRYGLAEELEDQVLLGDGVGENFTGILNAGIQTVGSAGTDLDAIVDAIRAVRVTGRRKPTAMVIHPNDWYSTGFLLSKDANGNYLVGDPRATVEQLNQLWGLTVIVSEAITENTALVGDFRQAVLWEREGISLSMTDSHADFFVRNLLVILAEMRAAFGVLDPQAFCTVTAL